MSNKKIKVLIVDDEPIGRDLLEAILTSEGYELIFGKNGEEAFSAAIEHQPDIILLDVMMPKMDGFEVCEKIREIKEIAHIPIFLITALDDRDSKRRGIDAGANDYISKPFDRIEIMAKVKNSVNLIRNHKHNQNSQLPDNTSGNAETNNLFLLKKLYDLHFSQDLKNKNIQIHRSLPPYESTHAFFHSLINTKSMLFMFSTSLKESEAVIMNLFIKELLLQNSIIYSGSPLKIVNETYNSLNDLYTKNNANETDILKLSISVLLYNESSESLIAAGKNQSLFIHSLSENKNSLSNKSKYQTLQLTLDQEMEITGPSNVFLFSSNVFETSSEQDAISFLNMNFSKEKQVNFTEAIGKFNTNRDIIIVNLSI